MEESGQDTNPYRPPEAEIRDAGSREKTVKDLNAVRGWLLVFCVGLAILVPLGSLLGIFAMWGSIFLEVTDSRTIWYIAVSSIESGIIGVLALVTGVALWQKRQGAIRLIRTYFYIYTFSIVFNCLAPFLFYGADQGMNILREMARSVVGAIVWLAIWSSYFSKSVRVRRTYGSNLGS